jgi:hypothetical protein
MRDGMEARQAFKQAGAIDLNRPVLMMVASSAGDSVNRPYLES